MIGAGIFSLLGVASEIAGTGTYLAFACAGALAFFCAYSFGKLGATYPTSGGPVEFLAKGFGDGTATGGLSLMLWIGYVFALALYARAFGEYTVTTLPEELRAAGVPTIAVVITGVFLALNIAGAKAVGKTQLTIVGIKLLILIVFTIGAATTVSTQRILPMTSGTLAGTAYAAAIVFMAYEGFGLITNAAEDMHEPKKTLPRALLASILITMVFYVGLSMVTVGSLTPDRIAQTSEYALAEAAKPAFGSIGFAAITIAALLATGSAINATLYGGANVSYSMADRGTLPRFFNQNIWRLGKGGLILTAGLVAVLAAIIDLSGIAMMGSAAFLVVYGAVNGAHLRLTSETGAKSWPLWIGFIGCGFVLVILIGYMAKERMPGLIAFVSLTAACFAIARGFNGSREA
jgi:amino acid transporter